MRPYKHFRASQRHAILKICIVNTAYYDVELYGELRDELLSFVNEHSGGSLLIDLSEVEYCSTAVMQVLISARLKLLASGGQLKLCGVNRNVRKAFEQLRLDRTTFDIHDSQTMAIASF